VVIDEKEQQAAALAFDLEATAHGGGERGALVAVRFFVRGTTGVVQQQGEVEDDWLLQVVEELLVELYAW
jgi:hypothetical protein